MIPLKITNRFRGSSENRCPDSHPGRGLAIVEPGAPAMPRRSAANRTRVPRVSVIIPCYNTSGLVGETLQSVFAQTYRDFEVVVVNDGSPDTPELEQAIALWRDRIVYVHTENCGLAGARNNGIRAAKGGLIALLDSDDLWEPNYLGVQVAKLDEYPDTDIVYPNALIFGAGPDLIEFPQSRGKVTFASLVEERCVVMVSVLARRSALERAGLFDDSLRSCEDFDMWLRCVKQGSKIIYHPQPLVRYRRRPGSLSADPVWMCDSQIRVLQKMRTAVHLSAGERRVLERSMRRVKGKRLFYMGKQAFNVGNISKAIDCLEHANQYLHSLRTWLIVRLIRTVPTLARAMYAWRTRLLGA